MQGDVSAEAEVDYTRVIPPLFHRVWLGGGRAIPDRFEEYWKGWKRQHPSWVTEHYGERGNKH